MGHLGGDKTNQVVLRLFALPAVSKTPLGGSAPAPGMRIAYGFDDFEPLNFYNEFYETDDILILVCIKSSLCLVAFFGFFRFLI